MLSPLPIAGSDPHARHVQPARTFFGQITAYKQLQDPKSNSLCGVGAYVSAYMDDDACREDDHAQNATPCTAYSIQSANHLVGAILRNLGAKA